MNVAVGRSSHLFDIVYRLLQIILCISIGGTFETCVQTDQRVSRDCVVVTMSRFKYETD